MATNEKKKKKRQNLGMKKALSFNKNVHDPLNFPNVKTAIKVLCYLQFLKNTEFVRIVLNRF